MDIHSLRYSRRTLRYVEDELAEYSRLSTNDLDRFSFRELRRLVFAVRQLIESDLSHSGQRVDNGNGSHK